MNIKLIENQKCNIYLTLFADSDIKADASEFEVYGAAQNDSKNESFVVEPLNEEMHFKVTVPALRIHGCRPWKFQIFVRNKNTGNEWLILDGRIEVGVRCATNDSEPKISLPEYEIHYVFSNGNRVIAHNNDGVEIPIPEGERVVKNYLRWNDDYTEVSGNLDDLTNGSYMFQRRETLTNWDIDLPSLTNGSNMFGYCSALTNWDIELPALTNSNRMFNDTALISWNIPLPSLTDGSQMFYQCQSLASFSVDLPKLTNGTLMFYSCSALTNWDIELPALTNATSMFRFDNLTNWDIDLPSLTNGNGMFYMCRTLTSFTGNIPLLIDGDDMFYNCSLFTSFSADLPALTKGSNMFYRCQLNKESALRVLNTIPTHTSGTHKLTIGIHRDHKTDEEVLASITTASEKGWTVTTQWNGVATSGVSTADLDMIYAKMEQDENGVYTDTNGVRYMIDWGHIIASPQGTPAELGYELFYSLDEALTQWGLTEITL